MSARLIVVTVLLALLLVGSAIVTGVHLRSELERAALADIAAQFAAAHSAVEAARREDLALRAGQLATDRGLAAYIIDALTADLPGQPIDVASISDVLAERQQQLGLDVVGVMTGEGRWITGTRPWSDGGAHPLTHALFKAARKHQAPAIDLVRDGERWYLGSILPLGRAAAVDGWLYAAVLLDERWLSRITALVPVTVSVIAADHAPQAPLARPLFEAADRAVLAAWPVEKASVDPLPPMLGLAATWVLLAVACAWFFAWRILTPCSVAVDVLERAAAGDLHLRAPAWQTGLAGRFAAAFERLLARARTP